MKNLKGYLSRAGYRILTLGALRIPLRFYARLVRQNLSPALSGLPEASNVLVLAPHMDDETIGCGGTLLAHAARGRRIEVVFITDGEAGIEGALSRELSQQEKLETRRRESGQACEMLGVATVHHLDLPDGRSSVSDAAVEALDRIIDSLNPDIVYLPFFTDTHHDHRVTNRLFLAAVRKRPAIAPGLCCAYEVWTPIHANCVIDISEFIESKMEALSCYRSQLDVIDYLHSIRGLNAYRSISYGGRGYAEAFYLSTVEEYLAMAEDAERWSAE